MYGNFKKKYPGNELKQCWWRAARASTKQEWNLAMDVMKGLNEAAYNEMIHLTASHWARSFFPTDTCCDLQVNNMCEAFNMAILDHREKPIISLLEGIKHYLTTRIVKHRGLMQRWRGNLCPMIQQKLDLSKKYSDFWTPIWHGDYEMCKFEVTKDNDKYAVDLATSTCACRRWDLTGIPCQDVVSCIWWARRNPEDYVHPCYL